MKTKDRQNRAFSHTNQTLTHSHYTTNTSMQSISFIFLLFFSFKNISKGCCNFKVVYTIFGERNRYQCIVFHFFFSKRRKRNQQMLMLGCHLSFSHPILFTHKFVTYTFKPIVSDTSQMFLWLFGSKQPKPQNGV